MTRTTLRTSWTRFGLAVVTAATLASCTSTPTPDPTSSPSPTVTPSPTPTPTPTESVDPEIAAATAAALDAYEGFWDAQVTYLAEPNQPEPDALRQYAVDKALSGVRETVRLFQDNGIVARGEPVLSPAITEIELQGEASAVIVDCVDSTNWQPVYEATGESAAAPNQLDRQVTQSRAFVFDGHWVIGDSTVYRDRSC